VNLDHIVVAAFMVSAYYSAGTSIYRFDEAVS
jgi:hypothetical protein